MTACENQSRPDYVFANSTHRGLAMRFVASTREFTLYRSVNSRLGQGERLPSKSRSKPFPKRGGILQMNPTFSPVSRSYPKKFSLALPEGLA